MTSFYDDIDLDDMRFDADKQVIYAASRSILPPVKSLCRLDILIFHLTPQQMFTYPCPCGDRFQITVEDLEDGEEVMRTRALPACSQPPLQPPPSPPPFSSSSSSSSPQVARCPSCSLIIRVMFVPLTPSRKISNPHSVTTQKNSLPLYPRRGTNVLLQRRLISPPPP